MAKRRKSIMTGKAKPTDSDFANACHKALRNLADKIIAAEDAGLDVHIYVPEDDGSDSMAGARISIGRDFMVEDDC